MKISDLIKLEKVCYETGKYFYENERDKKFMKKKGFFGKFHLVRKIKELL